MFCTTVNIPEHAANSLKELYRAYNRIKTPSVFAFTTISQPKT